jgi:hypothetical protein
MIAARHAAPDSPAPARSMLYRLTLIVTLVAALMLVHGAALRLGLFMDDLAHERQLRAANWTLKALTDACRLELVGGTIEIWWLPETTLRFFRPVAFGLMKLAYTAVGWSAGAMHVVSLGWHTTVCLLALPLLRRCGASWLLAWAAATLLAIHPAHTATVQWIACQSELIVTALLLGATLLFARAREWPGARPSGTGVSAVTGGGVVAGARPAIRGPSAALVAASLVLFALALGCRENAIMWPVVMLAVEWLALRRFRWSTLRVYAVLAAIIAAYLALRSVMLGGAALPPKPYVMPPGDPEFPRYVFDKALYYLLGQFLMMPCVPIAGLPYLRAQPLAFYGGAAAVSALPLSIFIVAVRRRERDGVAVGGVLGVAWLAGFTAPLLPVFESPHHLYLPAVGWAIVWMLLLRAIVSSVRRRAAWLRWTVATVVGLGTISTGLVFARVTTWLAWTLAAGEGVQNCMVEEIAAAPTPVQSGDTLYIADMPMVAHYLKLALEDRLGVRDLRVVPLMWSPRLLGVSTPTELRPVDAHTFDLVITQDRWFAGPFARLIEQATGRPPPEFADHTADLGFTIDTSARDAAGVERIRVTFARPPGHDGLHFFWTSRARWAMQLQPDDLKAGE